MPFRHAIEPHAAADTADTAVAADTDTAAGIDTAAGSLAPPPGRRAAPDNPLRASAIGVYSLTSTYLRVLGYEDSQANGPLSERRGKMAKRRKVGNLLALALLSLLAQRPMYPYEMAQTLRARGKDKTIKINWGSLYTVVRNLRKYGFIEEAGTDREGRQPERTIYQITEQGMAELRDWLRELLSVPEEPQSPFAAALSEGGILPPAEVVELLTKRLTTLDKLNTAHAADLKLWTERLPRVFLVEAEYQLAMRVAEANWVRGLLKEIAEGTISGLDAWRRGHETGQLPEEFAELDELAKQGWPEREGDEPVNDA